MESIHKIQIVSCSGAANITHVNITDFGIAKGKTPVTIEKIREIVENIENITI